jgi:hypothetical protein
MFSVYQEMLVEGYNKKIPSHYCTNSAAAQKLHIENIKRAMAKFSFGKHQSCYFSPKAIY